MRAFGLLFLALLAFAAPALSTTLDFEGLGLSEGTLLTNQYPGVSFTSAMLVLPGNPTVGFNGNSSGSGAGGPDNANSGATVADDNPNLNHTMSVTFASPVGGLSLEAADVELATTTESVEFRVFDVPSGGTPLQTVVVAGGDPGTGDGTRKLVNLSGFAGDTTIRRVDIRRLTGSRAPSARTPAGRWTTSRTPRPRPRPSRRRGE
jgi:hypothetical protein